MKQTSRSFDLKAIDAAEQAESDGGCRTRLLGVVHERLGAAGG